MREEGWMALYVALYVWMALYVAALTDAEGLRTVREGRGNETLTQMVFRTKTY